MNPEGNIECELISTKGTTLSDEQILKNFQAAIAADPNRSGLGRKAAGFQNLKEANFFFLHFCLFCLLSGG